MAGVLGTGEENVVELLSRHWRIGANVDRDEGIEEDLLYMPELCLFYFDVALEGYPAAGHDTARLGYRE